MWGFSLPYQCRRVRPHNCFPLSIAEQMNPRHKTQNEANFVSSHKNQQSNEADPISY
jgi:hypothetical protein